MRDTYRTLTAVDGVIMVIDCVGSRKTDNKTHGSLSHAELGLCPLNKLDRGRDPFELIDEIEEELKMYVDMAYWHGKITQRVYNLYEKKNLFEPSKNKQ